ncbi:hypothetical protein Tco_1429661 [Tanacetum coccineum]
MVMPYEVHSKVPYTPTNCHMVKHQAAPGYIEDSLQQFLTTTVETVTNMTPENRAHYESEKEAIHLILTGIGDEIYSTVDACQTAQEMWEAIERLQTRSLPTTRKQKAEREAKPITPPSLSISASEEDCEPEQAHAKIRTMQKNLALIAHQVLARNSTNPTNNNLRTTSNTQKSRMWELLLQSATVWDTVSLTAKNLCMYAKNAESQNGFKDSTVSQGKDVSCVNSCYMAKIQEVLMQTQARDAEANGTKTEFERYKAFNDRTVDYDKLEHKLNEALGLLAQKEIDIKEGLKVKACEISIVKEKHDELVKQSLLTKSHYEGLVKEKTKVITDLKLKEEKDIDKMISMENQIKFLNEIVYKRSQSIQTIHMLAPKCPTFNGRSTFANPRYLKKAQYEHPDCQEQLKNDTVCKEKASNVFRKEREQYFEIQDLKAQMQDKNMPQPNAQEDFQTTVLGKPLLFRDSLERKYYAKKKSFKTNDVRGFIKPVPTTPTKICQSNHKEAVRNNTNVINPACIELQVVTTQTRAPQLNQTSINTNPLSVSTSTVIAHKN